MDLGQSGSCREALGRSWWVAGRAWLAMKLQHCAVCLSGVSLAMDVGHAWGAAWSPGLLSPSSQMHEPRQKWFVRMVLILGLVWLE